MSAYLKLKVIEQEIIAFFPEVMNQSINVVFMSDAITV